VPTVCQPVAARGPNDPQWHVRIFDISAGGVGLIAVRRFERGTGLAVEIPAQGDYPGDTLLARVVRIEPAPGEGWLLGCAFVSVLSEDTATKLARLYTTGPQAEYPHASVANHAPEHSNATAANGTAQRLISRVRWHNRETGLERVARHMHLTGKWPLPPRTVLRLWQADRDGAGDYTRVVVHSCAQEGDAWLVSYSVLGAPSARTDWWVNDQD
jgi:hypothetical protein